MANYLDEHPDFDVDDPTDEIVDLRSQLQAAQAERDRMLEGERGGLHKEVRVLRARAGDAERERDALRKALERTIPAVHGPTHNCRFEDCQIPAREGISCAELRVALRATSERSSRDD